MTYIQDRFKKVYTTFKMTQEFYLNNFLGLSNIDNAKICLYFT